MTLADQKDIEAFSKRIKQELGANVEEVILFGSYATDEYVPGSDIDIVILVSNRNKVDEEKIWDIVEENKIEKGLHFSPKIYERKEFENKAESGFSFFTEVEEQAEKLEIAEERLATAQNFT